MPPAATTTNNTPLIPFLFSYLPSLTTNDYYIPHTTQIRDPEIEYDEEVDSKTQKNAGSNLEEEENADITKGQGCRACWGFPRRRDHAGGPIQGILHQLSFKESTYLRPLSS